MERGYRNQASHSYSFGQILWLLYHRGLQRDRANLDSAFHSALQLPGAEGDFHTGGGSWFQEEPWLLIFRIITFGDSWVALETSKYPNFQG